MARRPEDPTRALVEAGVVSIEQLDALIAIHAAADGCTIDEVARAVRASADQAGVRVSSLGALGLVAGDDGDPQRWRIARPDLAPCIQTLADAMPKNRRWVVNQFYSRRLESLRAFSDAFKLRGDT